MEQKLRLHRHGDRDRDSTNAKTPAPTKRTSHRQSSAAGRAGFPSTNRGMLRALFLETLAKQF